MTLRADEHTDLAALAATDRHRPRFHVVSPGGWLNDPNGFGRWDGTYHLFYQYNPHAPTHDRIHWGHLTSTDLVHWTDEPVALTPGDDGPDEDGCWSGVLVDDGGVPTLVYSGRTGGREVACVAVGSADLRTWTKDAANPVVAAPPAQLDTTAFRDHCVWREDGQWQMLIGSGIRGAGGTALQYSSPDLRSWTYQRPLLVGDAAATEPVWTGTMWECVDLFAVDGTDVLVFSAWHEGETLHPVYLTGSRQDGVLVPDGPAQLLDLGRRHFYAPQSMQDADGRRILLGWMQEARDGSASMAAGWSGAMSLPREVRIEPDGRLTLHPVEEIDLLRAARLHDGVPTQGRQRGVTGNQLDLVLDAVVSCGGRLELRVLATEDGVEGTTVIVERSASGATVHLDRSTSSLDRSLDVTPLGGGVPVGPDGHVEIRVLVDHSALELFVNGRALAARVYPTREDALEVTLGCRDASVRTFDAWRMADAWSGPRQTWPTR